MRRGDIERLKAFFSRQVDRARRAYDRSPTEAPRQCVFVGTTIAPVFLRDSGNQRYWPVRAGRFDAAAIERDRDHLWAEAAAAEANGEGIRLAGKLWPRAPKVQEEHTVDPWLYTIERVLGDMTGRIATASLFEILMLPEGVKRPEMCVKLASCMRELGWDNNGGKVIKIGRRVCRGYLRGNGIERWREITTSVDPIARKATVTVQGTAAANRAGGL